MLLKNVLYYCRIPSLLTLSVCPSPRCLSILCLFAVYIYNNDYYYHYYFSRFVFSRRAVPLFINRKLAATQYDNLHEGIEKSPSRLETVTIILSVIICSVVTIVILFFVIRLIIRTIQTSDESPVGSLSLSFRRPTVRFSEEPSGYQSRWLATLRNHQSPTTPRDPAKTTPLTG